MKIKLIIITSLLFNISLFSQVRVNADGKVKIGSGNGWPSDQASLEVIEEDKTTEIRIFAASHDNARLWTLNQSTAYGLGVDKYGKGHIYQNIHTPKKIMSFNPDGNFGIGIFPSSYFKLLVNGNAFAIGNWIGSDKKLKENIKNIDNPLDIINDIEGKKYQFIDENHRFLNDEIKERWTYGFIAQDIKEILPDLVKVRDDSTKLLSINYDGFIPIIVEALKKQQYEIENLRDELESIKMMTGNNKINYSVELDSYLSQNNPNPFAQETTIKYFVTQKARNARIDILDIKGVLVHSFELSQFGNSSINLSSNDLESGEYIYSLFVNDTHVDSKKLLLLK